MDSDYISHLPSVRKKRGKKEWYLPFAARHQADGGEKQ